VCACVVQLLYCCHHAVSGEVWPICMSVHVYICVLNAYMYACLFPVYMCVHSHIYILSVCVYDVCL